MTAWQQPTTRICNCTAGCVCCNPTITPKIQFVDTTMNREAEIAGLKEHAPTNRKERRIMKHEERRTKSIPWYKRKI